MTDAQLLRAVDRARRSQQRAADDLAARDKVIAAHLGQMTHAQIAEATGLSAGTINRVAVLARKGKP